MSNGFVTCPCCGQILYVSYNDLIGFTTSLPIFNSQEIQNQTLSQQCCSIKDALSYQLTQAQNSLNYKEK